jgi:hypothetical protein
MILTTRFVKILIFSIYEKMYDNVYFDIFLKILRKTKTYEEARKKIRIHINILRLF